MKLAIASGKGGTGKTLVATNLFYALQQLNYQVVLVDCDAEAPNDMVFFKGEKIKYFYVHQEIPVINEKKCKFCSKCHEYCNYNAIFILPDLKVIKVIEDLCHGCGACDVACDFNAISTKPVPIGSITKYAIENNTFIIEASMNTGVFSPVPIINAAIKEAKNEKIVILDSPPGTSCPFINTVAEADFVVLVTEPTPFGLSDLKQSIDTLKIIDKPYGVVINRSGIGDSEIYNYLKQENIKLLLEIPFDKMIAFYYSNGELISQLEYQWADKFVSMFNFIIDQYGNSNN